jgi:hypothetical protein
MPIPRNVAKIPMVVRSVGPRAIVRELNLMWKMTQTTEIATMKPSVTGCTAYKRPFMDQAPSLKM